MVDGNLGLQKWDERDYTRSHTRRLYVMGTILDRFLAMSRTPGAEVVSLVDVTRSLAVGKKPVGLLRFAKRADVLFIVGGLRRSVRTRNDYAERMTAYAEMLNVRTWPN